MSNITSLPSLIYHECRAVCLLAYSPQEIANQSWTADLFHWHAHRVIFEAVAELAQSGLSTDLLAVTSAIQAKGSLEYAGGVSGITDVLTTYGGPMPSELGNLKQALVSARSFRMASIRLADAAMPIMSMDCDLSTLAADIAGIAAPTVKARRLTLDEQLGILINEMDGTTTPQCYGFGLPELDGWLRGGIRQKEIGVVTAGTSGGKSILLGMAALDAARNGRHAVIYSLEMSSSDYLRRIIAAITGKPTPDPRRQEVTAEAMKAFLSGVEAVRKLPLTIIDDITEAAQIMTDAGIRRASGKLDIMIVDYLQLVSNPGHDTRELAVSDVSQRLKNFANTQDIAVLTASQLNDDGRLRESRAIGMHADTVLLIVDGAKIEPMKFRSGSREWSVNVTMRGDLGRFEPR